jgi:hypothetical protein
MIMMKNFIMNKSKNRILLALAFILILSLSCNLPILNGGGSPEQKLEENIQASGLLFVDQVLISEELVTIEYQVLPEDDPEVMVSGWLNALLAAYEAKPDAGQYLLVTSLDGEPYLEIRAQGLDLQALVAEEFSVVEFLERLEVTDIRPAEDLAREALAPLELAVETVSREGDSLVVVYSPDPTLDESALMTEWWEIFSVLSEQGGEVSEIEIQALIVDGSKITVVGDVDDIDAYLEGEVTALQFMAGLEVVVEEMEAQ